MGIFLARDGRSHFEVKDAYGNSSLKDNPSTMHPLVIWRKEFA